MNKTNVMRLLDSARVAYEPLPYEADEDDLSGVRTADALGVAPESLFKTLVLSGERTGVFVCCIPCNEEIDLKKAARAAGDKAAQMLPMKSLLETTGYIRGGVSPIGMRRKYPLFIDETCGVFDRVCISGGMRGEMIRLSPNALVAYTNAYVTDLIQTNMLKEERFARRTASGQNA